MASENDYEEKIRGMLDADAEEATEKADDMMSCARKLDRRFPVLARRYKSIAEQYRLIAAYARGKFDG